MDFELKSDYGVIMMKDNCRMRFTVKRILFAALVLMSVVSCNSIITRAATYNPRLSEPATDSPYYSNGAYNPYVTAVGTLRNIPNCTTYAWGRAYEILGTRPPLPERGDAGSWYGAASNKGQTPKLGAVACWSYGKYGHVAVVEVINGNNLTLSESSFDPSIYWQPADKNATNMGYGFQGYIYIGDFDDSLILSKTSVSLYTGDSYQLSVSVTGGPETTHWVSSNPTVASVSSTGLVQAKSAGKAEITAKFNGASAKCVVSVKNKVVPVSIKIKAPRKITINKGKTYLLRTATTGKGGKVTYKVDKKKIVSVSKNGLVRAKRKGTTVVRAYFGGKSASCTIKVVVPSLKISKKKITLKVGKSKKIKATVKGASKIVTWKSSNPSVAQVSSKGVVKAVGSGKATIIATANGITKKCKVTVKATPKKKSITLNTSKVIISKGSRYKLIATVTGMNKSVTWKSSNKTIATVKGGVITGKKKGTATITAKCGKLKTKCKVTVKDEGIYHTDKVKTRYKSITPFSVKVSIKGDKLFVEGELLKSLDDKKYVKVSGKKHVFVLCSNTQYWEGYYNTDFGDYTKEMFLANATRSMGEKELMLSVDVKDGRVYMVGIAPFTYPWEYSFGEGK